MSIDDNEIHHARAILDEIFGNQNFVTRIFWQKIFSSKQAAKYGELRGYRKGTQQLKQHGKH